MFLLFSFCKMYKKYISEIIQYFYLYVMWYFYNANLYNSVYKPVFLNAICWSIYRTVYTVPKYMHNKKTYSLQLLFNNIM